METHRLETRIRLAQPRERIFEFFADPQNLERLTPPSLRFEILSKDARVTRPGTRLDYRLRIRGIPVRWQSEISVWEPPARFVDRQVRGPYRLWIHEHTFANDDAGGTWVGDNVEYAVPGGRIVQRWLVAPELERIFRYRHQVLEEIFRVGPARSN